MVAPQVDDQRIGPRDQLHRRGDDRAGLLGAGDPAHVQVADVAVQPLGAVDAVVARPPRASGLVPARPGTGGPWPARPGLAGPPSLGPGLPRRHRPYPQVLVVADLLHLAGEPFGERLLVEVVVLASGEPGLDRRGGLPGEARGHVVPAQ